MSGYDAVCVGNLLRAIHSTVEVLQQTVFETVHPTVYRQLLTTLPGILHNRGVANMRYLGHNIQFTQQIQARLPVLYRLDPLTMPVLHILNVAQPVIDQPLSAFS